MLPQKESTSGDDNTTKDSTATRKIESATPVKKPENSRPTVIQAAYPKPSLSGEH